MKVLQSLQKNLSFSQLLALKRYHFTLRNHNINYFFIQKINNMKSSSLLNMNFPFAQSSCFCKNFFLFLTQKLTFLSNIKNFLNFNYKKKCETKFKNFFFLFNFSVVAAWYMSMLVTSEVPWSRVLYLKVAETKTKTLSF